MKYCPACGHEVALKIPPGDNRQRACCDACGSIHYENPRMVVGTVTVSGDKVLLCKRAIEPRYGFWTLPGGFMENGETSAEGAERETNEEAGARIELGDLYSLIDIPQVDQVHIFYLATLSDPHFVPGTESLEARLFTEDEIPWSQIAFKTVYKTLRWYFDDLRAGRLRTHTDSVRFTPRTTAPGATDARKTG
ncbi:MAG: NUDIX hydrolase [Burkholderiaceae bacterium]